MLNQPIAYAMYQKKYFILHASAINIDNYAYIFLGPSGSGKSFIVKKLLNYGKLISEDICRVSINKNQAMIHFSHPLLKTNDNDDQDIYFKTSFPLTHDKRKRFSNLIKEPFLSHKTVEIKGCFSINFSEKLQVKELNEQQSFASSLMASFKSNPFFSDPEYDLQLHANIGKLISVCSFFSLSRQESFNDFKKLNITLKNLNTNE